MGPFFVEAPACLGRKSRWKGVHELTAFGLLRLEYESVPATCDLSVIRAVIATGTADSRSVTSVKPKAHTICWQKPDRACSADVHAPSAESQSCTRAHLNLYYRSICPTPAPSSRPVPSSRHRAIHSNESVMQWPPPVIEMLVGMPATTPHAWRSASEDL